MDSLDRPIPVPRSYYGRAAAVGPSPARPDYIHDQRPSVGNILVGGNGSSSENEDDMMRVTDRPTARSSSVRGIEHQQSGSSRNSRWPPANNRDHFYNTGNNHSLDAASQPISSQRHYGGYNTAGPGMDNIDGPHRGRRSPQKISHHHQGLNRPSSTRVDGVPNSRNGAPNGGRSHHHHHQQQQMPTGNRSDSCSSLSSVGSGSSSGADVDNGIGGADPGLRRREVPATNRLNVVDHDTLEGSSGGSRGGTVGENVYSRIRDIGFLPVIPPPPADTPPAVPHRIPMSAAIGTQTLGRRPVSRGHQMSAFPSGHAHHPISSAFNGPRDDNSDCDQPPRFLMHTSSGNIFIPSGNEVGVPTVTGAGQAVPTFPRTVPRTVSLQRTDRSTPGADTQNRLSSFVDFIVPPPPPAAAASSTAASGDLRTGNSHEQNGGERQTMATRFNMMTSPSNNRPSQTAAPTDLRDYLRYKASLGDGASYRDKKQVPCDRWLTWKCGALMLMCLTALLVALVAYLIAVRVYNLSWRLQTEPVLTDAYLGNGSVVAASGTAVSSIIARYQLGQTIEEIVPAHEFLRTQFFLAEPEIIKFDVSVPRGAVVGIFGRKNTQPSYTKYDFFHAVDGDKIVLSRRTRSSTSYARTVSVVDATFTRTLDVGVWYVFTYNDNEKPQQVTFSATRKDDQPGSTCIANCNGHGECIGSTCHCFPGYVGVACNNSVCPAVCSDNGEYFGGTCKCFPGWTGAECHLPAANCINVDCSQHGACVDGRCICAAGYGGESCAQELCTVECGLHGRCESGRCLCESGWTGSLCNERQCDARCVRGQCNNGTCVCQQGWNGRHCTIEGCPSNCGRHGNCQQFATGWGCECEDGWKGAACSVARESECANKIDEDGDGLVDCYDPDCCIDIACRDSNHCRTAPDPMDILLRKQPPSPGASFYDKMRFLVEDDSVQSYATLNSFNQTQVSVIRGRVLTSDGTAVVGVRVSVVTQPLYGFTLTREQGWFDMLANGGGSVTLHFQRQPFQIQNVTVIVPWNRIITIDPVTLTMESESGRSAIERQLCDAVDLHDYYSLKPVVMATWQHAQFDCCDQVMATSIVPETRVLRESLRVSGTGIHLTHDSSDTPGYQSALFIALTGELVPSRLSIVRLRVVVEGVVFERDFEADANLQYRFTWDRRNAYNQKVYGVAAATVTVGYIYEGCRQPFWEVQTVKMAANDLMSTDIGSWNIDIHHIYSVQDGVVYKGDGTNIYLMMSPSPHRMLTVLGDVTGRRRRVDCHGCDGRAEGNMLLSPVALASGRDGALYVGDYNFIRRLSPGREDVSSILQLTMPDVQYKYYMVVSPLDGRLYITDQQNLRIIRVKTMGPVRDLANNFEVIAGTGQQCVPGNADRCGDGGPATDANLFYPKGIAISKDGIVYFADGANIRAIDQTGTIRTIIGSQGAPNYWKPFPCRKTVNVSEVMLRWPSALAVNPLDDTLHVLDDNVIFKITRDRKVVIFAGSLSYCNDQVSNDSSTGGKAAASAFESRLEHAQNFAFSPDGELFLIESNGQDVNRIRAVNSAGRLRHYVGTQCDCRHRSAAGCRCNSTSGLQSSAMTFTPSAIAVTPDGVAHVADTGAACVHSATSADPVPDRSGQFEVVHGPSREVYLFNRYGQHLLTRRLGTGQLLYNFTYDLYSHYGRLSKITDYNGQAVSIRRDHKYVVRELTAASRERTRLTSDSMGQLQAITTADNVTTRFTYSGNTGLIDARDDADTVQQYDYNDVGHLQSVTLTNGKQIILRDGDVSVAGKLTTVTLDGVSTDYRIGEMTLSVSQGNTRKTSVTYGAGGTVTVELPSGAVIYQEFGEKLPATNEFLASSRRVVQLPGGTNMTHVAEWWTQQRQDSSHGTGSRGSSAAAQSNDKIIRRLKINGDTILTIDLDKTDNIETVFTRGHERLVTMRYDRSGRPVQVVPSGPLEALNISYSAHGHVTHWSRGSDLGVVNVYDEKSSNLAERKLANRVQYRYIYKAGNKPTDVILPSGLQYQLHYSTETGGLVGLTTPSLAHHQFQRIDALGINRVVYQPPDRLHAGFMRDYDSQGRIRQVLFPSGHRRITYYYDRENGLKDLVFYDWTDVVYERHPSSGMLIKAELVDRLVSNMSVTVDYGTSGALIASQSFKFKVDASMGSSASARSNTDWNLTNATFRYTYDQTTLNVLAVDATIGERTLRTSIFNYSTETGRLTKTQTFTFEFPQAHRESATDSNIHIVRDFDSRGRLTDVWYRFNNYLVFTLEVKYDTSGRVHQWRRKIGSSDQRVYERVYNIDGDVTEVLVSGQQTWRYEYDVDGNIIRASHHSNVRSFAVDARTGSRLDSASEQSYVHDADGRIAQRDRETFEYDAFGALTRAFEPGRYDVTFIYDAWRRLVAKRDSVSGETIQYYYADLAHPDRITHVLETRAGTTSGSGLGGSGSGRGYQSGSAGQGRITELLYDSRGKLFATRTDGNDYFYVALDPTDTPVVILNSVGSVIKQLEYDPLGAVFTDSAPDLTFPLGFHCGIVDRATRLILFPGGRAYDPSIGRWMVPDFGRLLDNVDRLAEKPEVSNLYSATSLLWKTEDVNTNFITDMSDWLLQLGYDFRRLLPTMGDLKAMRQETNDVISATFEPPANCALCQGRSPADPITQLSAVRRSKIVSPAASVIPLPVSSAMYLDVSGSRKSIGSLPGLFGRGVLISSSVDSHRNQGPVVVNVLDSAVESQLAAVATTILNVSTKIPLVYTVHGRDLHHFVHRRLDRASDDLRDLGLTALKADTVASLSGVNITVATGHRDRHRKQSSSGTPSSSNSESAAAAGDEFVEIRLHGERTSVAVRYGTTPAVETDRVLRRAGQRAAEMAWTIERERAQSKKRSIQRWTQRQQDELVSAGQVPGFHPIYVRSVSEFPELADDPNNVQFVTAVNRNS